MLAVQGHGGSASNRQVWEAVAVSNVAITPERTIPVGDPWLAFGLMQRLSWARTALKGMGLLLNVRRGIWAVTESAAALPELPAEADAELQHLFGRYEALRRHAQRPPRAWRGGKDISFRFGPDLSLNDRLYLLHFSTDALDLLLLDDLWSDAANMKDPRAATVGRAMVSSIETLRGRIGPLSGLLTQAAPYLDSNWPAMLERWELPPAEAHRLDRYVSERGGLGAAGVELAQSLDKALGVDLDEILLKTAGFEAGELSAGDMAWTTRTALGVVAICAVIIAAVPLTVAGVGATGVAAGAFWGAEGLAALVGGVVASALVPKPTPRRPTTR